MIGCGTGEHPFDQEAGVAELFQQITCGDYIFRPDIWCDISPEAQDLIRGMMTVRAPTTPPEPSFHRTTCIHAHPHAHSHANQPRP